MGKKKIKKVKTKKSIKSTTKHVVEVRVQSVPMVPALVPQDLSPVKEGGKYMIPKSWVTEKQVIKIVQKTPSQFILRRKGRGGMTFDYVPGHYFKQVLNYCFGWNWDFKITRQEVLGLGQEWGQVIVTGQLTVKDDSGHTITKEDTGKADIKYLKGTKNPMDIGNDYKAANTDCLKRCCVQLGIAADVYGAGDARNEGFNVQDNGNPSSTAIVPVVSIPTEKGIQEELGQIQELLTQQGYKTPTTQLKAIKAWCGREGIEFDGFRMTKSTSKNLLAALLKKKHQ